MSNPLHCLLHKTDKRVYNKAMLVRGLLLTLLGNYSEQAVETLVLLKFNFN